MTDFPGLLRMLAAARVEFIIVGGFAGTLQCLCLGFKKLIEVKRAAGRPQDLQAVAALQALLEEREKQGR